MKLSGQISLPPREPTGLRALRAAGWLLISLGFVYGLGGILVAWIIVMSWNCWWISTAIALAIVCERSPLRLGCRLVSAAMFLIWLVSRCADLQHLAEDSAHQLGRQPLGLMLAVLGALLVLTNCSSSSRRHVCRSIALMIKSHRKALAALCVSTLIVANPTHSHSLCMSASTICEQQGAYAPAIAFAVLARDTFPPPTFCGTCYAGMRQDLSWRIARIEAKRSGVLPPQTFDAVTPGNASATTQPRIHETVHSISARRETGHGRGAVSPSP